MTQVCGAFAPLSRRKIAPGCVRTLSLCRSFQANRRERASMVRRSLDLSPRVQKVYAFIRQSASPHGPVPLANVALAVWGIM
jgi:hypothetical protein